LSGTSTDTALESGTNDKTVKDALRITKALRKHLDSNCEHCQSLLEDLEN
jgi:hypothetical protein